MTDEFELIKFMNVTFAVGLEHLRRLFIPIKMQVWYKVKKESE